MDKEDLEKLDLILLMLQNQLQMLTQTLETARKRLRTIIDEANNKL